MSLGDLQKQVNDSGAKAFTDQHEKIMKEGEAHISKLAIQKEDTELKDLAHMRLRGEHLTGEMEQLRKDIAKEKSSTNPNLSFIKDRETQLHKLQNDHLHVQGEIMKHKGMDRPASHIRYNNPHYF